MADKELSILIPTFSLALSVGSVVLKPFKFKQVKDVLSLIEKYSTILFEGKEIEVDGEKVLVDKPTADLIKDLLGKSEDDYTILADVQKFIAMVSPDLSPEIVDELGYDEVFYILSEIVDKNRDFFQRLMKKVNPQKAEPSEPQKDGQPELAA